MPHNENKLRDLLEYLSLGEQIVKDINEFQEKEIPCIEYEEIRKFMKEQRKVSEKYLQENIGDDKKKDE